MDRQHNTTHQSFISVHLLITLCVPPPPAIDAMQLLMQQQAAADALDNERLEDAGGGLMSGNTAKIELMKKLARDAQLASTSTTPTVPQAPMVAGMAYPNGK